MTAKIKLNAASGGGSFSLQAPSSSSNARVMTLPDTADGTILTTTNPKSGNILQVVQGMKTSRSSFSGSSFLDVGLKCNLTPSSASNKVLVMINLSCTTNVNTPGFITLARGGSDIAESDTSTFDQLAIGDADGSRTRCSAQVHHIDNDNDIQNVNVFYLDSPNSTLAVHYETFIRTDGSGIVYVNGTKGNADNVGHGRTASTIIAMEIAG